MAWSHYQIRGITCTNGTSTIGKRLVVQSNGRLWSIFSDNTTDQIWVGYSDNNGVTWTNAQLTNNTYTQIPHAILIDTNNRVCILWGGPIDSSSTTYALWFRRRTTLGVWEDPVQVIANTTKPPRMATMACDWSSHYHITWSQSTLNIGYNTWSSSDRATIDHTYSGDGYVFETPETITSEPSPLTCHWSGIVFNSYNVMQVIYATATWSSGAEKLMYTEYIAGWSTPVIVVASAVQSIQDFVCDNSDNLHVIYTTSSGLIYYRREFIGPTWTGKKTLLSAYGGWEGTLSVDNAGKVWAITSYEWGTSRHDDLRTLPLGGSWSGASSISNYGFDRMSALQQNLPFYAPSTGMAFVTYGGPYVNEIYVNSAYVPPAKPYTGGFARIM